MEEPYSTIWHNLSLPPSPTPTPTAANSTSSSNPAPPLDYDIIVILAAMTCALVCALGLNSMLQCVVRCTRRTLAEPARVATRRLNAGLKREHVVALPISTFSAASPAATSPPAGCPTCLSDFSDGDKIRVLPACRHRFHVGCIDTWLLSHCSCPTCRNRLSAATQGSEVPLEVVTTS